MCIADGYVLAENREQAKEKLKLLPYHNKYEEVELAAIFVAGMAVKSMKMELQQDGKIEFTRSESL